MGTPSVFNSHSLIEENVIAILDSSGFRDSKEEEVDRLAFLVAVRAKWIVPESGTPPPSNNMRGRVFEILRSMESLELIMGSYQLLIELDERFPQVYISSVDALKSSSSTSPELVVVKEVWSPFVSEVASFKIRLVGQNAEVPLDSSAIHVLVQGIAELVGNTDFEAITLRSLGKMLLLQYFVNVLEGDFLPRNNIYKGTMNWSLLRQSLLNTFLSSCKRSYKDFIKDCLYLLYKFQSGLSNLMPYLEVSKAKYLKSCDTAVAVCLLEVEKSTSVAVKKLLVMIMELDSSKKQADAQGYTTRADSVRTPAVELIVDVLTYNDDIISPFLQVLDEPEWKLEISLQYFWKYAAKPTVRTRWSNSSTDDKTLHGVLKCFANITFTKKVIKKLHTGVTQILLAQAFQAYLSLSLQDNIVGGIADSKEFESGSSLVDICQSIILAFQNLKRADERAEIVPLGKEALFSAATTLATKS